MPRGSSLGFESSGKNSVDLRFNNWSLSTIAAYRVEAIRLCDSQWDDSRIEMPFAKNSITAASRKPRLHASLLCVADLLLCDLRCGVTLWTSIMDFHYGLALWTHFVWNPRCRSCGHSRPIAWQPIKRLETSKVLRSLKDLCVNIGSVRFTIVRELVATNLVVLKNGKDTGESQWRCLNEGTSTVLNQHRIALVVYSSCGLW